MRLIMAIRTQQIYVRLHEYTFFYRMNFFLYHGMFLPPSYKSFSPPLDKLKKTREREREMENILYQGKSSNNHQQPYVIRKIHVTSSILFFKFKKGNTFSLTH